MISPQDSEEKILKHIVSDTQATANSISFALRSAFPFPEHHFAQNIYVGINIQRTKLGLEVDEKPGDIDLLIVPEKNDHLMLQKCIAIEVKIVRPTMRKPSKNVNKNGVKQVYGLLRDGFPFVGLLHIAIPEPLPKSFHTELPLMDNKCAVDGSLIKTGKFIAVDPFPLAQAERQEGRLATLNLPNNIAYKTIAFHTSRKSKSFLGNTIGNSKTGKINNNISQKLLENIDFLVRGNQKIFNKIIWFNKN